MKPLALGLVVGLVVASAGAQAADQQNRFAPKGAGAATCARYLEERKGLTRTYAEFGGWIDGFVSAYNLLRNDTYDILTWEDTTDLARLLANFCCARPDDRFASGLVILLSSMEKDRLRAAEPVVRAEGQAQTVILYRQTLARVQAKLATDGYFVGPPSGVFDKATEQAVAAYQRQNGLTVTGVPDRVTLRNLMWPRRSAKGDGGEAAEGKKPKP